MPGTGFPMPFFVLITGFTPIGLFFLFIVLWKQFGYLVLTNMTWRYRISCRLICLLLGCNQSWCNDLTWLNYTKHFIMKPSDIWFSNKRTIWITTQERQYKHAQAPLKYEKKV
jgi:hypothetical protein